MIAPYADSMGFLGWPAKPIQVPDDIELELVHLTSAPPWGKKEGEIPTMEETLKFHEEFLRQVESQPRLAVVRSADDINQAFREEKIAVVLGLQHAPKDVDVEKLFKAGIRVMGIAYDEENEFGSGWQNPRIGLKKEGRDFLSACAELGMILDLSHSGHETARGALEFTSRGRTSLMGVMASHGGCHAVYKHGRNLPDDVLDEIAGREGVIGIAALTFILDAEDNGPEPFLRHLGHAFKRFGLGSVCVGSDSPYVRADEEEWKKSFEMMKGKVDPDGSWRVRWPEYIPKFIGPDKMPGISDEMFACGFFENGPYDSRIAVEELLGRSLVRFFRNALPD